jgi:hypothetical protein
MRKILILLISLSACASFAQTAETAPATTTAPVKRIARKTRPSSWLLSGRTLLWQERSIATENGAKSEFQSQFMGFSLGTVYQRAFTPRLWQSHSLEVITGTAHIVGASGGYKDNLKNQSWHGATLRPGLMYRTSVHTDVVLCAPLVYRSIKWVIGRDTLSIDTGSDFTYGIALQSRFRLQKSLILVMGVGQMQAWSGSLWELGLDYKF